jgi:hypothetical protein
MPWEDHSSKAHERKNKYAEIVAGKHFIYGGGWMQRIPCSISVEAVPNSRDGSFIT